MVDAAMLLNDAEICVWNMVSPFPNMIPFNFDANQCKNRKAINCFLAVIEPGTPSK